MAKKADMKPVEVELTRSAGSSGADPAAGINWQVVSSIATLKEMRKDAQIGLGLELVKAPIYSAEWNVECKTDKIGEFVQAEFKRLWRSFVRSSLAGVEFGFAPHEKLWSLDGSGAHIKQFKDLDPADCTILKDDSGDFAGIRWKGKVVVPAEKCFLFTHWKEFGNLYGRTRLERAMEPWQKHRNTGKLLDRYLKRRAIPQPVGHAPAEMRQDVSGAQVDTMKQMQKAIQSAYSGDAVVLPAEYDSQGNPLWDITLLKDDQQRSADFLGPMNYYDTKMLRGIIVPERAATQGDGAVYAIADSHIEMFLTLEDLLLFDLLDQANRYVLPQVVAMNFGPGAEPAALVSKGLSERTKEKMRSIVEKILAGPVTNQLAAEVLDVAAVVQGAGLPVLEQKQVRTQLRQEHAERLARIPEVRAAVLNFRDERVDIMDRATQDAVDYYDALIGRVKKNSLTPTAGATPCAHSTR